MANNEDKAQGYTDANEILDKMIELKKSEHKTSFGKSCFLITSCIAIIIVLITLCIMLYKNNFAMESLISLLLAFFSIFISVFFYFKADEASNRFYETSYNFMKEVSVTLGKIEERFGEKLNSLNDKVSHLSAAKEEKKEELESAEDEKQAIIDDLLQKAQLNDQQRAEYRHKLRMQDRQISELQHELSRMRHLEYQYGNTSSARMDDDFCQHLIHMLNPKELKMMRNLHPSDWPQPLKEKLKELDLLDSNEDLTVIGREFFNRAL